MNLVPASLEAEQAKLKRKLDAGAKFVIAQPVYDFEQAAPMLRLLREEHTPVLAGLIPLKSLKLAEYLHFEVPGITVPKALRDKLAAASSPEAQREIGLAHARELLAQLKAQVAGACLMPVGDLNLARRLLAG